MPADIAEHAAADFPLFTDIAIVGPIQERRPLAPLDRNAIIREEPSSCDREAYRIPSLNSPHPTQPGLYFVGDTEPATEEIGDVLNFNRSWASIPASRTEPLSSYAYQYPGISGASLAATLTITAVTFGAVFSTITIAGHGYTNNQYVLISVNYTSNGVAKFFTALSRIFGVTANTFQTYFPANIAPLVFSNGTARGFIPKRGPTLETTTAVVSFDYALPGVTPGIATAADFVAHDVFRIIQDSDNSVVTTLAGAPTPTRPTLLSYIDMIQNQNLLVAESAVGTYRGNILERRTVYVPAQ